MQRGLSSNRVREVLTARSLRIGAIIDLGILHDTNRLFDRSAADLSVAGFLHARPPFAHLLERPNATHDNIIGVKRRQFPSGHSGGRRAFVLHPVDERLRAFLVSHQFALLSGLSSVLMRLQICAHVGF